ncbi:MAG: sugar phosphate nucleotidyltransferase [Desulforhopalus sp.]
MQAMILAAGLGTRLLPHTLIRPKPLFPILNQPLLLLTIKRLQKLGFDHIVVNCHHLRDQVVAALEGMDGVVVVQEETILGTGGGLRNALPCFQDKPLLVSNGDIYHTVDILDFYRHHIRQGNEITLAMHDYPRFNTVPVADGRVVGFDNDTDYFLLAFTGLHVIEPEVLRDIQAGTFSSIIDHYKSFLKTGGTIGCYRVDGCFWTDMGTVEDYLALHQGLLTDTIPVWQEAAPPGKPYCIDGRLKLPAGFTPRDWVCVGNAQIGNGAKLERVVVWDNVVLEAGTVLADAVVSSSHP